MPRGGPPDNRVSGALGALVVYVALVGVVMAPVLADPLHLAIGAPANDVWNHLWGHAWVQRSLASGALPIRTSLLAWPAGGALWYIDTLGAVLSAPVQVWFGPVAAYNATIAGNLLLAGFGADLLARRIGAGPRGALVAGVCFALTPHVLAQVYNGVSEATATGWLPLTLALVLGATRVPDRSDSPALPTTSFPRALLAGLSWGAGCVASAYIGVGIGLTLLVLLAFVRTWPRRWWVLPVGLGVGATLAAAGPLALFATTLRAPDALVHRDLAFVWSTLLDHNQTDVLALVHPFRWYSPDLRVSFHEELIVVVYTGAALWLPALVVLGADIRARRRGATAAVAWAAVALLFTVLSLGPFLYVAGQYVTVDAGRIPLPYYALFRWVPGFAAVCHPYRFAVGTSLGLSMIAALGVTRLEARGVRSWPLVVAWTLARAVESLVLSPAVWPLPVTEVRPPPTMVWIDALEGDHPPAAVLDLPLGLAPLERSAALAAQITARDRLHPVPYGFNDPLPDVLATNHYTRYLAELERRRSLRLPATLPLLDLAVGARDLRAAGLRWIVVHRDMYGEEAWERVRPFLEMTATLRRDGGDVLLYELVPG
jgi:hypothetical protein